MPNYSCNNCGSRIKWDTRLSEDICKHWYKIASDITQATTMPFPRQCIAKLLPYSSTEVMLHVFTDTSPCAYGAVAYLQQGTQSAILISKSRAAPLKQHTFPRLELMAAVIGTRLYNFISTSISVNRSGLTARSSYPGLPARRNSNPLSAIVSMKYNQHQHLGNIAHQLIIRLTC